MKNLLTFIKEGIRLFIPSYIHSAVYNNCRIIPHPCFYYSFNSDGLYTKYIPSESDILGISGGNEVKDKNAGQKEIKYTYWKDETEEYEGVREVYNKGRSIWVWIATTSIIIIFAIAIINNRLHNYEMDKAYQTYFSLPDVSFIKQNIEGVENIAIWSSLEKAYNQKQFSLIREQFRNISNQLPVYKFSQFLNGICLMQENKFKNALECFNSIEPHSSYSTQIKWYSALCYLKLGNLHSARLLLGSFDQHSNYSKKAIEILRNIKEVN